MATFSWKNVRDLSTIWSRLAGSVGLRTGVANPFIDRPYIDEDQTLYVATTGDDGNPGTSDRPFKTIQAQLDSLRGIEIRAKVLVSVGPGSFDGFEFGGFNIGAKDGLGSVVGVTVEGSMTLLASGTATSGGTDTITDSGANWTVDQFKGKQFLSSVYGPVIIVGNTSNTLTLAYGGTLGAADYKIYDWQTSINCNKKSAGATYWWQTAENAETYSSAVIALPSPLPLRTQHQTLRALKILQNHASGNGQQVLCGRGSNLALVNCSLVGSGAGFLVAVRPTAELLVDECSLFPYTNTTAIAFFKGVDMENQPDGRSSNVNCYYSLISGGAYGANFSTHGGNLACINSWFDAQTQAAVFASTSQVTFVSLGQSTFRSCAKILSGANRTFTSSISGTPLASGNSGNTSGVVLTKGASTQIASAVALGASTELSYDGTTATLATMRQANPKLLTNTYGTIIYE